jgi:AAA+ ATPase superfamily predicted ATPase
LYFDERPKERPEDLYDREEELRQLLTALKERRSLILVLGPRRSGKTSLLQTGPIYNKNFSDMLGNLVKSGFVEYQEEKYTISDPVLRFALSRAV